jgi:hypothetical protein
MRRLALSTALVVLPAGIVLSIVLFSIASFTKNALVQTILLVVSMAALFYSSHALSHYVAAVLSRVGVRYFFVAKSDFRRLSGLLGTLGKSALTIGIKFEPAKVRQLPRMRRAFLFGSGAIVSNALLAAVLLAAWLARLPLLALVLGVLFLLVSVGTEVMFGTKVGDLRKMRRELSR